MFWLQRPILSVIVDVEVLEFCPFAGLCMFESLAYQSRPVYNRSSQIPHVYKVEFFLEGPRLFRVVYLELYVGRDP